MKASILRTLYDLLYDVEYGYIELPIIICGLELNTVEDIYYHIDKLTEEMK